MSKHPDCVNYDEWDGYYFCKLTKKPIKNEMCENYKRKQFESSRVKTLNWEKIDEHNHVAHTPIFNYHIIKKPCSSNNDYYYLLKIICSLDNIAEQNKLLFDVIKTDIDDLFYFAEEHWLRTISKCLKY